MRARILYAVTRLIGEFAEIDLFGMARVTQHVDIGARTEDALLAARDHDDPHFGMLEPDAVKGVVELDIDPEVIGVELQSVTRREPAFLLDVERQRRDRAIAREAPVAISIGFSVECGHRKFNACLPLRDIAVNRQHASFFMRGMRTKEAVWHGRADRRSGIELPRET